MTGSPNTLPFSIQQRGGRLLIRIGGKRASAVVTRAEHVGHDGAGTAPVLRDFTQARSLGFSLLRGGLGFLVEDVTAVDMSTETCSNGSRGGKLTRRSS